MPNKSSRILNAWPPKRGFPGVLNVLAQGVFVFLTAVLALFSGGVSTPAIGLVVLSPLMLVVFAGRSQASPGILAALIALIALGLMSLLDMLPPPIALFEGISWIVMAVSGLFLFMMLLKRQPAHEAVNEAPVRTSGLEGNPFLIVSISPYGRVKACMGDTSLVPGIREGKELAPLLAASDLKPLATARKGQGQVLLFAPDEVFNTLSDTHTFEDIAGLSHDLKTPLTSILGFAQMMRDRDLGDDIDLYQDYPGLIYQSGETLQSRVETLLDFIKAKSGSLELDLEPFDVETVVKDIVSAFDLKASETGIVLATDIVTNLSVIADRAAYTRILENLISNAIKYTDTGCKVFITAEVHEGQVITTVTDQGTGIGAADLEKLANPYVQADHTGSREGTGLGLALVKRLTALQDGAFVIRTAKGRGTQMIVKLPAHVAENTVRAAE